MGDLIRAECMQVYMRPYFEHPGKDIRVCVNRKIRMYSTQQTDFSDAAFEGETGFFLNCRFIIAVSLLIICTPAKTTKTAEVLAYIRHMEVLISDVGYNVSCAALPHLIGSRCNPESIPAPCVQKPGGFRFSKTTSAENI
jgi:hypothetical protein